MLSRPPAFVALAVVTTLKSATKLKVDPSIHVEMEAPLRSLTLLTCATLTSPAEQFSDCLSFGFRLYSCCKQVCADEVAARTPIANSATAHRPSLFEVIHRNEFESLVPMMVFLLVVCAHVYFERGAWDYKT